jgi:hypothetical protein
MKGSTKFWIIILIPLLIFLNYKSIPIFIANIHEESPIAALIVVFWGLEFAIFLIIIVPIIFGPRGLLNKFNTYLDEKF